MGRTGTGGNSASVKRYFAGVGAKGFMAWSTTIPMRGRQLAFSLLTGKLKIN
jgi:hypothetical protein